MTSKSLLGKNKNDFICEGITVDNLARLRVLETFLEGAQCLITYGWRRIPNPAYFKSLVSDRNVSVILLYRPAILECFVDPVTRTHAQLQIAKRFTNHLMQNIYIYIYSYGVYLIRYTLIL